MVIPSPEIPALFVESRGALNDANHMYFYGDIETAGTTATGREKNLTEKSESRRLNDATQEIESRTNTDYLASAD